MKMIVSKEISFRAGLVLTEEMLQELRAFPQLSVQAGYEDYGDGILCGFKLIETNEGIIFSSGLLKLNGKIYSSYEPISITVNNPGEQLDTAWYAVVLRQGEDVINKGIVSSTLQICYVEKENIKQEDFVLVIIPRNSGSIKLPKFNLSEGEEKCFKEFTAGNRCNLFFTRRSALHGYTYIPEVFDAVREYLSFKKNKCVQDYVLLMELQNKGVVSEISIRTYIQDAGIELSDNDNRQFLFGKFEEALKQIRRSENILYVKDDNSTVENIPKKRNNIQVDW